jgi:hypothetical protein
MAEVAARRHLVADELLELLGLREAASVVARPNQPAVHADLEHAARVVGDERDRAEFLGESGQQLLREPCGPEQPAAQPAIGDGDVGPGLDGIDTF